MKSLRHSHRAALVTGLALVSGLIVAGPARADESVPAELALKVMLRVLAYDAAFSNHGTGDFTVVVPWKPGAEKARDAAMAAAGGLAEKSIKGRPLKFVALEFSSAASLADAANKAGATAFLAPAGLVAEDYGAIANATRRMKAYGLSLVPAGVDAGVMLGVANNGGRPQILLHREASQEVGASWPPAVLRLARVL